MSFAKNFAAGQQIAAGLVSTYEKAKQQREIAEVMDAQPTELQGFTAQDGEQMQAMASAVNPQTGQPYYAVEDDGRGGLQVRNNFSYAGADGVTVEPGSVTGLAPRKVTDFLGQRFEGAIDPDKVASMRYGALADIIGKEDPIRGLQMRREVKRDERDDLKFTQEQEDRTTKKDLEANRRSYYRTLSTMKPEELAAELGGSFNPDGSGVEAMLTFDPKANRFLFASNVPGIPSRTLDRAELINYAMGVWEQGNGSFESGMKMQLDTLRTMREQQEATRGDAKTLAVANAGAFKDDRKHAIDLAELAIKQQNANTNERYRRDLAAAKGDSTAVDAFQRNIDGVLEGYQAAMAAGKPDAAAIYAREYDQLRALTPKGLRTPPALSALNNAQKAQGASKPVKVEEAGQPYLVDGQLKFSDGRGSFIAERGIMPQDRTATLVKKGVPDALVSQLQWNQDGTRVLFGDVAYDVRDPEDLQALRKDYKRVLASGVAVREANLVDHHTSNDAPRGLGPRLTAVPHQGAPSIYAGPDAWQRYRNLQGQ